MNRVISRTNSEAMLAFGSPIWIRQDLIRVLPNEDAMI